MAKRSIKINLNFLNRDILSKFTIKQFDNATITVTPLLGLEPLDPRNNTCKLYVSVGEEVYLQGEGIQTSENSIIINLDRNIVSSHGRALAELELLDSNGVFTSTTFIFEIEPKVGEGATLPGQVEGFIAKHERLISEFRAEVNPQIQSINSNLKTLDATVSQQGNKNGEQDLKLKQIEYKNKVQDVYVQGLFNENNDKRLTIEGEGNSLKLEGSKEGLVTVDKVVGNTFVNLGTPFDSNKTINKSVNSGYATLLRPTSNNVPTTLFLNILDINLDTQTDLTLDIRGHKSDGTFAQFGILAKVKNVGWHTIKLDTNIDLGITDILVLMSSSNSNSPNVTLSKDYMLLEGDYTNKPIPSEHFTGMQSSFEECKVTQEMVDSGEESVENLGKYKCEVEVRGKNLFDKSYPYSTYRFATTSGSVGSNVMVNNLSGSHKNIRLELPKGEYGIQINMLETYPDKWTFSILETDKDIMELNDELKVICSNQHSNNTLIKSKFTVSKKYQYIRISYNLSDTLEESVLSTIQIEEGAQATSYEPYYYTTKTVYLNSPSLKGDEVVYIDGELKHYHKCDKYVLNGTENWVLYSGANEIQEYPVFYYNNPSIKLNHDLICDNIPVKTTVNANTGTFGIGTHSTVNGIRVCIENSKLSSRTIAGFKAWLRANPVTIVYELAEPYYETIDTDRLLLEIPNNATVSVKSVIPGTSISASYTGGVPSVYGMESDITTLQDTSVDIIATGWDTDYRLSEVEWALEDNGLLSPMLFNINTKNIKGGNTMALTKFEQAKIMILGGAYNRVTLTRQLDRYLEKKVITQSEYDELIALMEAKELVTGE